MMKKYLSSLSALLVLLVLFNSCKKTDYSMGDLTAPTNIVINAEIVGQDASNPDGDGSGAVNFTITGENAITYKIDFDANDGFSYVVAPAGMISRKYITLGLNTYTVTVIAYGKGGIATTVTKDITLRSDFEPDPQIVTNLTNDASKTWVVDKDLAAHFGVGPYDVASIRPEWYAATPNEKAVCCPCFYSASFVFTKVSPISYTLQTITPDGAFTKTGALAGGLPGIPATGPEGCYSYGGATSAFSFAGASSGAPATGTAPNFNSTQTSMILSGTSTFIGYGAVLKEYEILEITPTTMHLRVQGTETGNAWYLRLKSL